MREAILMERRLSVESSGTFLYHDGRFDILNSKEVESGPGCDVAWRSLSSRIGKYSTRIVLAEGNSTYEALKSASLPNLYQA